MAIFELRFVQNFDEVVTGVDVLAKEYPRAVHVVALAG